MSTDTFVDHLRRSREAEHADSEKPEELLCEDVISGAAFGFESFAVVGEVVAGVDNRLNPVLSVRGHEVEERPTGKVDALLDAVGVSHPLAHDSRPGKGSENAMVIAFREPPPALQPKRLGHRRLAVVATARSSRPLPHGPRERYGLPEACFEASPRLASRCATSSENPPKRPTAVCPKPSPMLCVVTWFGVHT